MMRVLICTASKHGSTREVGEWIAQRLRVRVGDGTSSSDGAPPSVEVTCCDVSEVTSLEGLDAVVVGSAVYMMTWLPEAVDVLNRYRDDLAQLPVFVFSVAMTGVPDREVEEPKRMRSTLREVGAVASRTFAGRVSRDDLSLAERSIITMARSPEGDFRARDEIDAFADVIAEHLGFSS